MILKLPSFTCLRVCIDITVCSHKRTFSLTPPLTRITEENKHCLYYSNEYVLGNKLYIFPLTPFLLTECQEWLREACDIWFCWHQTLQSFTVTGPLTLHLWKLAMATSLTASLAPHKLKELSGSWNTLEWTASHHNRLQRQIQRQVKGSTADEYLSHADTGHLRPLVQKKFPRRSLFRNKPKRFKVKDVMCL